MISVDSLKELILSYKRDGCKETYYEIIMQVDYLIYYYIKQLRKKLPYLNLLEIEELYHTSLIALHIFIKSFKNDTKARHIPCRLRSYMKVEFTKTYRYLERENNFQDIYKYTPQDSVTEINTNRMDYDILLDSLMEDDKEMLDNYLTKRKQVSKMAKENGVAICTMTKRIRTLLNSIRG